MHFSQLNKWTMVYDAEIMREEHKKKKKKFVQTNSWKRTMMNTIKKNFIKGNV